MFVENFKAFILYIIKSPLLYVKDLINIIAKLVKSPEYYFINILQIIIIVHAY